MHESNLVDCGYYAIYASSCSDPTNMIDATNNWWGVADSAEIEALVYHQVDEPGAPVVDFVPFAVDSFDIGHPPPEFYCGDANSDEAVNVGDAVYLINYVFRSAECTVNPPIGCPPDHIEAGDANCDSSVNVGDAVYMVNFVFKPGAPLPCATCPKGNK